MDNSLITKTKKSSKDIIFTILRQKAFLKLYKKYSSNKFSYNIICINNIIYNESCLIVAKFKDFLIYDDNTDFLRKFYTTPESKYKLYKILDLYENYSKIFPNYLVVKEKKFMYKNIRRKQKMIDAFNQIKLEEEENRKKIKERNSENKEDNMIFTDLVKNEIKTYQKDNNNNPYKNSFDSQNDKDETDTLFGQSYSHSSISINLISKKDLLSPKNNSKGLSFESKTNETNGTISSLLNIINDNKIYIKDLPNIFKVNLCSNNIIEKKIISFRKKKNTFYKKESKINSNKNSTNSTNNINTNNNNNIILQKIILTPKKDKKEVNINKNHFHFNSTLLSQKRIKMLNPTLINTNSNSSSINKEKKNFPSKQNIYIPSTGNTIININNNFYQEVSKTERFEPPKLKKLSNLNNNKFKTIQNSSREKEEKIKKDTNLNTNNNIVLHSQKNSLNKNLNYIKCKHISHDFSYKRNTTTEIGNKTNNKIYNNLIINNKRELSPQYALSIGKHKNIIQFRDEKYSHSTNVKEYTNIKNDLAKLNTKNNNISQKSKGNYRNKNSKDNKVVLSKDNKKKVLNLKNHKYNFNEFSSLSFINTAKTETSINAKTITKMIKNKKIHRFKEKQNTCFNFVKNKNLKINKEIFLQDKFFTTYNKTIKKIKNTSKKISDFIIKNQKPNKSYKSRDKSKNIKINHSIKNKILKSEARPPSKKYIFNYINKINKSNNDNLIEYTTICEKKNNNNKLLDSKSIEKRKKCESIDFSNNEYHHNKYVFTKIDSIKRNSYVYSPKNSFSHFINKNIKKNKMINDYFNEKAFLFNQPTIPSQQDMYTINQNDMRTKYKTILLTKNNKKSYDFNSDIQKRYKQNILNKINNLKNMNKDYCLSNIRKSSNSNSIDLNNINYSNRFYSNSLKNKSKDKDKESDNKDLFKKIMCFKMNNKNKNKTEEKVTKSNNKINEKKNNNIPMTIKVNTSNFLSKIKEKYKKSMI